MSGFDMRDEVYRFLKQQKEFRYPDPILPGFKGFGKAPSSRTATGHAPVPSTSNRTAIATSGSVPGTDGGLSRVQGDIAGCTRCALHEKRTNLVFGVGNPNATLMFIGEAPGADEDDQGEPFVGRAGQLLNKIFAAAKIHREDVYITNIVKCRPPGNRDPQPEEVSTCNPFLQRQIEVIQPKLICALGRFAAQTLLQRSEGIGRLRGRWFDWHGKRLICTYHPSACLRNETYKRPVWHDFQMLRDAYQELTVEN